MEVLGGEGVYRHGKRGQGGLQIFEVFIVSRDDENLLPHCCPLKGRMKDKIIPTLTGSTSIKKG